jgi:uncharacterized protein (TIGR02284 family)
MSVIIPALPHAASVYDAEMAEDASSVPRRDGWGAVAAARTRTLDALAGFEKMVELAQPEFAPTVMAFRDLHDRHANSFTRMLTDAGHPPADEGSMMGTVNRVVVATRALFDEIDADVLSQIRSGEEHVLAAYDEALEGDLPADVQDQLVDLRSELAKLLDVVTSEPRLR